jgi:predicted nucleotidyltransferase
VRVFGSVARGEAGPDSDLDVLVEIEQRRGLLDQAGLQGDLEQLLHCPVHVATTRGLRHARESTREQIEREAAWLWARGETSTGSRTCATRSRTSKR